MALHDGRFSLAATFCMSLLDCAHLQFFLLIRQNHSEMTMRHVDSLVLPISVELEFLSTLL